MMTQQERDELADWAFDHAALPDDPVLHRSPWIKIIAQRVLKLLAEKNHKDKSIDPPQDQL